MFQVVFDADAIVSSLHRDLIPSTHILWLHRLLLGDLAGHHVTADDSTAY